MKTETPRLYLPRTGQVTSYATGDDGDLQAGNPRGVSGGAIQATRYIDLGNGTISDRATGLQWVKQPELIIPGATGVHATNQVQIVRGNWATPNNYAAADLIFDSVGGVKYYVCAVAHAAGATLAADIANFPTYWRETVWATINTDTVESWTKGTTSVLTMTAHTFRIGQLVNISGVTDHHGVASPTVNGNHIIYAVAANTITINVNSSAEDTTQAGGTVLGAAVAQVTWANALTNSLALNYAGFSADWRVPNLFELFLLSDCSLTSAGPTVNRVAFPGTSILFYWSSTFGASSTYADYVDWSQSYPRVSVSLKTTATLVVRPVRGGRINA